MTCFLCGRPALFKAGTLGACRLDKDHPEFVRAVVAMNSPRFYTRKLSLAVEKSRLNASRCAKFRG